MQQFIAAAASSLMVMRWPSSGQSSFPSLASQEQSSKSAVIGINGSKAARRLKEALGAAEIPDPVPTG